MSPGVVIGRETPVIRPARSVPDVPAMMTTTTGAAIAVAPPVTAEFPGISQWLHLIQAEYREMPCLSLTKGQIQRLWGLEPFVCDALVDALVSARVLRRTDSGTYVAVTSGR